MINVMLVFSVYCFVFKIGEIAIITLQSPRWHLQSHPIILLYIDWSPLFLTICAKHKYHQFANMYDKQQI